MAKGKKIVELTEEERQQQSLERDLKQVEELIHFIPEPTYLLDVGTPVRIGAYIDTVVEEVLLGGKAYKIRYSSISNNYGNPIRTDNQLRIVPWMDIRKLPDENVENFSKRDDLHLQYSQRVIRDIFGKAYHFGIDFDPDYQRGYVWDLDDKLNLIDSIFNNVDIGKFVYVHNGYSGDRIYEILDGKQRITAILEYYEDRFPYKGKYFSDLSNRDQGHFEDYSISYAEIQNATREQKLTYFVKLNTGGRIMDKEHIDRVKEMLDQEQTK